MREVIPTVWYGERKLSHVPPHFVKSASLLTTESLSWVIGRLSGRYAISSFTDDVNFFLDSHNYIYFEDPGEAMMYELRWSGTK